MKIQLFLVIIISSMVLSARAFGVEREYNLTIDQQSVTIRDKTTDGMTINGEVPGPTLRFQKGDVARIQVKNNMSVATSIHWHGLLVPPNMDGVPYVTQVPILPGTSFTYEFSIRQTGTYWYHSHSELQEQRGLYGSIVIEDGQYAPNRDYVVLLSDWTTDSPDSVLKTLKRGSEWFSLQKGSAQSIIGALSAGKLGDYFMRELQRMPPMDIADVAYDYFLSNGMPEQTLTAKSGENVRLRIINGSATTYFHLNFAGGPMTIISADGQLVQPVEKNLFLIGVAETYDVLVSIPGDGAYELRATAHDGSGFTSTWLGAGQPRRLANSIPKPNLYEPMEHGAMGSIFALTPAGSMGMSDDLVEEGVFDMPGMSHSTHQAPDDSKHEMDGHDMGKGMTSKSGMQHKSPSMDMMNRSENSSDAITKEVIKKPKQGLPTNEGMSVAHQKMAPSITIESPTHGAPAKSHDNMANMAHSRPHMVPAETMPSKSEPGMSSDHSGAMEGMNSRRVEQSHRAVDPQTDHVTSARAFGNEFGLLKQDIASRPDVASEGGPKRPGTPYQHLKAANPTILPADAPIREIRLTLDGDMERYTWFLNNKPIAESDSIRIKEGEVTRFIMINRTMMHHPMHLHGHFFRVLNGQDDYSPLKHTVDVAPMSTTVIEFYGNEVGDWFFHCHLLYHMKSGMSRVVHYQDFEPVADVAASRSKLYADPFYFYGYADILSSMTEGTLILSNSRFSLGAGWEVGWQRVDETEWEGIVTADYHLNRFTSFLAGVDILGEGSSSEETRGILGFRYLLPLNFESTAWLDTDGGARIMLEKEFTLTPRFGLLGEVEYDTHTQWEGGVGLSYLITKDVSLIGNWHSEYGIGAGLQIRF